MISTEYCNKVFDGTHDTPKPCKEGTHKLLTSKNIMSGYLDKSDAYCISDEDYDAINIRSKVHQWDVLFSMIGSVGNVCIVKDDNIDFAIKNMGVFSCLEERKAKWLYYYLQSPYVKKLIQNYLNGAVQKFLPLEWLRNIDIPEYTHETSKIVDFMEIIDSKISNNTAICADLESIAKLLYDYWFVQFDFPDENGKPYKSSGGKMVWNDELKREIPAGWEVKPLSAFTADSKNGDWGNDKPKRNDDIEVTCFRGADFVSITDDYHVTAPIRYISANNSDRLLSDGDLVTEISGGSPTQATGRVGYINQKFLDRNGGKMDCSNFCKAFSPVKRFYQYWLYQTWKALYDAGVMFNYESKTTGIKNLMFDEFITWIRVPAPSDELLKKYQEMCSQYYDKIQEEFIESAQLASLRDFLLPMLMNGQVKVN